MSFDDQLRRSAGESIPKGVLVRAIVLAACVVVAAAWALVSHYAAIRPPMLVPSSPEPTSVPTYDPEAGEKPVPDIFWDAG